MGTMKPLLGAVLWLAPSSGCNDPTSHVYVAQLYEPDACCLEASSELDVISTGAASLSCAPACLVEPPPGSRVYVSTMCGPYPAAFDVSGTDPRCALALTAEAAGTGCTAGAEAGACPGDLSSSDAATDGGAE